MLRRLLILIVLLPLVELVLLVWIAARTGAAITLALVLVPAVLGLALARYEGLRVWQRVQEQVQRGMVPADSLLDGLMIWIAGILLVLPGVLSDVAGLLLLVPPIRRLLREHVQRQMRARLQIVSGRGDWRQSGSDESGPGGTDRDRILDVRVIDVESHDLPEEEQN